MALLLHCAAKAESNG